MMQSFSADDELFPLSWLSQWGYCPRRCGLLAIEQLWQDNELTAAGSIAHGRVHTPALERRGDMLLLRDQGIFSRALGVSGYCDCIEARADPAGVALPFAAGRWTLYPIEYKHGVTREETEYNIQLCAQAMCLEERFCCVIPAGAIFYVQDHRRCEVLFTDALRESTRGCAKSIHDMLASGEIPAGAYGPKCKKCSMADDCKPKTQRSARAYCRALFQWLDEEERRE